MHGPINVKSPNNTSERQTGFNSAFKGLMNSHVSYSEFRVPKNDIFDKCNFENCD